MVKTENLFICRYQDDGPKGICCQAMSITSPWDRIHIFTDEEEHRKFLRKIEAGEVTTRKNPRITGVWMYNAEYGDHHASQVFIHETK